MPKSSRDGMGTTTSRMACPAPELASLWHPAVRPERREPSLRSLPASLGARPPPVPRAGSLACSGAYTRGRGVNGLRLWCRMSGDHAWNETYRQGEVCKAPMENGGAKMEQCNNKTNNLDEIHRKSYEIGTNFVPISQFHVSFCIHTHAFT